ncbi:hypothetical protein [Bacillus sp. CRB-7]|uniref:hypothetical protein n=1 Tax=Bacillus sp. CRB-7 TaxID=2874284 RepID=UPI001CCEA3CE|nr:hypothetical protein [Bacillus sp. CRB-7]UBM53207.1 hypothetical protein K8M08_27180 [Bacillus sp. CRB-7]
MNVVEPIRDIKKIEEFLAELKKWNKKYYVLAFSGFYSGLRISDLLELRVSDVRDLDHFVVREQKTKMKEGLNLILN